MPAANLTLGAKYKNVTSGGEFRVTDIDYHEFDSDLTEYTLAYDNGEVYVEYADYIPTVKLIESPASYDPDVVCDCDRAIWGYTGGDYHCLVCGGK
jgi:hypothetical protein